MLTIWDVFLQIDLIVLDNQTHIKSQWRHRQPQHGVSNTRSPRQPLQTMRGVMEEQRLLASPAGGRGFDPVANQEKRLEIYTDCYLT